MNRHDRELASVRAQAIADVSRLCHALRWLAHAIWIAPLLVTASEDEILICVDRMLARLPEPIEPATRAPDLYFTHGGAVQLDTPTPIMEARIAQLKTNKIRMHLDHVCNVTRSVVRAFIRSRWELEQPVAAPRI